MGKVSIGLRGWRFDEEEVFTPGGKYRSFDEMSDDTRRRIVRLSVIAGGPCDACWLVHGDENLDECNYSRYVYGEPLAEVLVCEDHEPDFVYWFREDGGSDHVGAEDFDDRFHEWFLAGNRAPEGYDGMEYIDEEPETLPDPSDVDPEKEGLTTGGIKDRIDIRETDLDLSTEYPGAGSDPGGTD
jgi:hypothetical protein